MNRVKNLIGVLAFALLVLSLPGAVAAQWRDNRDNRNNRNDDDGYYRNDDYNRNGRNNRDIESTVRNLKSNSRQFEKRLDRELDNSRYNGRNREDRINQLAKDFADAAKRLDERYDDRRDYNNSYDEAQRVLQLGNQLDQAVNRARLNGNVQNDWYRIQQDLDVLANAYNYNTNARNNRNNRNNRNGQNRNGNWRNNVPFPLPF